MMPRTDMDRLPWPVRQELHRVTAMLFEGFDETAKGRLSEHYRAGRIVMLILHGPHARPETAPVAMGEAFHLLAVVNHPRLARRASDWRPVRDRMRRAWEHGEIAHPVRLTVESLERVNGALAEGVPHFITIATEGIALHAAEGLRLKIPRRLPASERRALGLLHYERWHKRAGDFLLGAAFYRSQGNAAMAALLLHQACEHFYQCALWTLRLHGPRSHALDELRELAEAIDARLVVAWPRDTLFERRAFGCIRRAYVEARYGDRYRIGDDELAWAMQRVTALHALVAQVCLEAIGCPSTAHPRQEEAGHAV
ncbi:HEPN domain-containing protein [Sphingomonas oryzagri]